MRKTMSEKMEILVGVDTNKDVVLIDPRSDKLMPDYIALNTNGSVCVASGTEDERTVKVYSSIKDVLDANPRSVIE